MEVNPLSSRQETSYNTPTKTPTKDIVSAADTGASTGSGVTWATKNQPLPWEVPAGRF